MTKIFNNKNKKINSKINLSLLFCLTILLIQFNNTYSQQLSFPGAEGFGRFAKGGRGGDVYIVTNLSDDASNPGEGSLRYGIENQDGPRTIVFEVSGTIELKADLEVDNPYLTIAGQTAPGDGITIKDLPFKVSETHDIIIRYIRFRLGDKNKPDPSNLDVINSEGVYNLIFDHISAGWGIDGIHDLRGGAFTLQWSIYGEALNKSLHEKGEHAMLSSFRDLTHHITLHHNLLHSSRDRHPSLGGGDNTLDDMTIDFRNNVIFNPRGPTNFGPNNINSINNYYKKGSSTITSQKPMMVKAVDVKKSKGFISGNYFSWSDSWTNSNFSGISWSYGGKYGKTTRDQFELPGEIVFGDDMPETQTAFEAYDIVLQHAGASKTRDAVDNRIVAGVKDGTNKLINSQDQVGGWPVLNSLPAPADTDRDGMPDIWETENGLNPNDAEDRNEDRNSDGYTNLEEYLYSITEIHIDVDPIVKITEVDTAKGYLPTDSIFIKVYANDYGIGSIKQVELFLDSNTTPFASTNAQVFDTIIQISVTGQHQIIAKATDDSGNTDVDTTNFMVGSDYYTVSYEQYNEGEIVLDPPGGTYINGTKVTCNFVPVFPYKLIEWTNLQTSENHPVITVNSDVFLNPYVDKDSNFLMKINFQPIGAIAPEGFVADIGHKYGVQENGLSYGWTGEENYRSRYRKAGMDVKIQTFNYIKSGNPWEILLPNDNYSIHIVCGETQYTNHINNIDIEGTIINDPDGEDFLDEYTTIVSVTDGKLTLKAALGAEDLRVCFLSIDRVAPDEISLFITDGSGVGTYAEGDKVNISADNRSGREFKMWTGDVEDINDVNDPTTYINMPATDLSITATYVPKNVFQAEDADRFDNVLVEKEFTGYNGTGYVNFDTESVIKFLEVYGGSGGIHILTLRWALNNTNRTGILSINETSHSLTMEGTESWSNWISKDVEINLNAGYTNIIRFESTGEDFGNLDQFTLTGGPDIIPEYSITVNNGSGTGMYFESDTVNISANIPADAYEFRNWTGDVSFLSDVNNSENSISMPSQDISLTANYTAIDIAPAIFSLTVENGTGNGIYLEGNTIDISADEPSGGFIFDQWTGDVVNIENINNPVTSIKMSSADASIIATYKEIQTLVNKHIIDNEFSIVCYPNPFSNYSTLSISLSKSSDVNIALYNLLGEKMLQIADEYFTTDNYELTIYKENLKSGLYLLKINIEESTELIRLIIK